MGAIVLQTKDGAPLGFMLLAGVQEPLAVGAWTVDCVFQALPIGPGALADKAFGCLAEHRELGEHTPATRERRCPAKPTSAVLAYEP